MRWRLICIGAVVAVVLYTLSLVMYLLPIHLIAFAVSIGAVVVADIHGLLWVLGRMATLPEQRMRRLHCVVGWGVWTSIVSGFLMFWPVRDFLLIETSFQVKVIFVLALTLNSLVIHHHMPQAFTHRFRDMSLANRIPLFVSGAVSTISWVGVFVAACLLPL